WKRRSAPALAMGVRNRSYQRGSSGARVGLRLAGGLAVVCAMSGALSGEELEIERGDHEVDEEEQQEGDHHGLVDRVADALGAGGGVESAIAGDDAGQEAED